MYAIHFVVVLVCRVSTLKENILIVGGNIVTLDEYIAFNYMASNLKESHVLLRKR